MDSRDKGKDKEKEPEENAGGPQVEKNPDLQYAFTPKTLSKANLAAGNEVFHTYFENEKNRNYFMGGSSADQRLSGDSEETAAFASYIQWTKDYWSSRSCHNINGRDCNNMTDYDSEKDNEQNQANKATAEKEIAAQLETNIETAQHILEASSQSAFAFAKQALDGVLAKPGSDRSVQIVNEANNKKEKGLESNLAMKQIENVEGKTPVLTVTLGAIKVKRADEESEATINCKVQSTFELRHERYFRTEQEVHGLRQDANWEELKGLNDPNKCEKCWGYQLTDIKTDNPIIANVFRGQIFTQAHFDFIFALSNLDENLGGELKTGNSPEKESGDVSHKAAMEKLRQDVLDVYARHITARTFIEDAELLVLTRVLEDAIKPNNESINNAQDFVSALNTLDASLSIPPSGSGEESEGFGEESGDSAGNSPIDSSLPPIGPSSFSLAPEEIEPTSSENSGFSPIKSRKLRVQVAKEAKEAIVYFATNTDVELVFLTPIIEILSKSVAESVPEENKDLIAFSSDPSKKINNALATVKIAAAAKTAAVKAAMAVEAAEEGEAKAIAKETAVAANKAAALAEANRIKVHNHTCQLLGQIVEISRAASKNPSHSQNDSFIIPSSSNMTKNEAFLNAYASLTQLQVDLHEPALVNLAYPKAKAELIARSNSIMEETNKLMDNPNTTPADLERITPTLKAASLYLDNLKTHLRNPDPDNQAGLDALQNELSAAANTLTAKKFSPLRATLFALVFTGSALLLLASAAAIAVSMGTATPIAAVTGAVGLAGILVTTGVITAGATGAAVGLAGLATSSAGFFAGGVMQPKNPILTCNVGKAAQGRLKHGPAPS